MTAPTPQYRVTVVTVAYNSMAVLPSMLASLPAGTPAIVIDNSPQPDPALQTLCDDHGARLVRNTTNRGFGAACNQGAALAETPYLFFLNPDATAEPGCVPALLAAAANHPKAAAFNPRTLDGQGRISFKRRSNLLPRNRRVSGPPPEVDREVPVLSGAAIFVAKDVFDRVGGFDENIFLYYEDDDLSRRLAEHGPLMHIPGAVVRHNDGHSTARTPAVARFKAYHLARSRAFAQTKHGISWPKLRVLGRAIRQLFSPLMLSTRKRAKYLGYLSGALSTFRDGGRHQP